MPENLETNIVVVGTDWNHYLAENFSNEQLSWVWWKHISFFQRLFPIPNWVEISEVVLKWQIKTKVASILN